MLIAGYREEEDGFVYPAWDFRMPNILHRSLGYIDQAVGYCRGRGVAVQAGGNCGLWPRKLGEIFEAVYTFEPDPVNFVALAMNTAECANVVRIQAALGEAAAFVDMNRTGKNCGAHYVSGSGILPTLRVDDLGLPACDLLYLDIEGSELAALRGAAATILEFKPVIGFEDKGLSQHFGVPLGAVEEWLASKFGYRVVERINSDTIMVAGPA